MSLVQGCIRFLIVYILNYELYFCIPKVLRQFDIRHRKLPLDKRNFSFLFIKGEI